MSFVTVAAVQQIAESLTVTKLSQDASKALAPHIDVRLREIIQVCSFKKALDDFVNSIAYKAQPQRLERQTFPKNCRKPANSLGIPKEVRSAARTSTMPYAFIAVR